MTLDPDLVAKIAGPAISLIVSAVIKHYAEARSRVVSFIGHVSAFTLQDDQHTVVHTHSVVVRNAGRKAARNVRLTHGVLPINVTVYPPVQHSIERNADGSGEIVLPVLVPKEQVTVSYLYFPPLLWSQINVNTKSDEGFAKIINVMPMPQPSKGVIALVWTLMFIGASFVFYWVVHLAINALQLLRQPNRRTAAPFGARLASRAGGRLRGTLSLKGDSCACSYCVN